MLKVQLICVGGLKESYYKAACAEYEKRLRAWAHVTVAEIREEKISARPSPAEIEAALAAEAVRIRALVPAGSYVCALCVEGGEQSSEQFSGTLSRLFCEGRSQFTFIIGGSFGLAETLKKKADSRLSFSQMTFPHMLARVLLLEQLYRALSMQNGGKYHK